MIKRINKITALVVAATSVMSMTPAMASERLEAKEGSIENAVAFKDGKYIYQGNKSDEDTGLHYNDGTNGKLLEDVDELDTNAKFADKYALVLDGRNQYKIDLSDGTISDEDTEESLKFEAQSKLKNKLIRTNRYGNNVEIQSFNELSDGQFGGTPWYSYVATGNEAYYKDVIGEAEKQQQSKDTIQVKTRLQIEITKFYDDIQIAGKVFTPAWGSNLPEALASVIKSTKFENYTVESVNAEKGATDNDGKVTVVLGSAQDLTQVPDGILLFDGKAPEAWMQMTTKILTADNTNSNASTNPTTTDNTAISNNNTTPTTNTTNTPNNTSTTPVINTTPITNAPTTNQVAAKSQVMLTITGFWGPITILGNSFTPAWGANDMDILASQIQNTQFADYTVDKVEVSNGVIIATFTTINDLGTTVPNGFTTGLDGSNGSSVCTVQPIVADTGAAQKSQITLSITNFWGNIEIIGNAFSPVWNGHTMDILTSQIKYSKFADYKVKSAEINNGIVTAVFTTANDLGTSVPNGFSTVLNGGNGNGSCIVDPIVTTSPAISVTTSPAVNVTTSSAVSTTTSAAVSTTTSGGSTSSTKTGTTTGTSTSTTGTTASTTYSDVKKILYYGYTDEKGNYIDCSKIANIGIYDGNKVIKFDNFNDKKVIDGKNIIIGSPTLEKTLGQDENYIYSLISVPVIGYQRVNGDKYSDDTEVKLYFVQKIAKVKGDKENKAYLPSKVESYQLNNDAGWDGGDNWSYMAAYNLLVGDDSSRKIRIIDGNIYVAHNDKNGTEVAFGKLKLGKTSRITRVNPTINGAKVTQALVYEDTANSTEMDTWTMDSNGSVWAIYEGKIKKSVQANEFQDIYRCDDAINNIDVYDDDNLIGWSDDEDIYITAKEGIVGKSVTKTGWQKLDDGTWHLYDLTGNPVKGWVMFGSGWYYMNDQGVMQTGWLNDSGKWYYLADSGFMKTGWVKVDGKWYCLDQSGARQENTTIDGYSLDLNGVWIQ